MQGGHDWYETLRYTTSHVDPCIQFKKEDGNYMITSTFMDDVFGGSNNEEEGKRRKDEIRGVWKIKDVGENEYFLGMHVQQDLELGTCH